MSEAPETQQNQGSAPREPAILLPPVISGLLAVLVVIHLLREYVLNEVANEKVIVWLAFVPVRILAGDQIEGGIWPLLWTPFTHALLHASWEHLLLNCAWLAIFGTPVARRYGTYGTLALFFLSALAGALLFAVTTLPAVQFLVGASGGIAGLTGAACRFIFQPLVTATDPETGERHILGRHLATLPELRRDGRAMFFIAIWLILNAAVPFLPMLIGESISIAWQAHLAGFLAGLFLVPLFERRPREQAP